MGSSPADEHKDTGSKETDSSTDLSSRVNTLAISDEKHDHDVISVKSDENDKNTAPDPKGEESGVSVAKTRQQKRWARELKALGVKRVDRPDYTKPLDEPSWGGSEDENVGEEDDADADADGVLDGEDESFEADDSDSEDDKKKV